MSSSVVPAGLGPALADVGLHLAGPLGSGGGGTLWSAVDATGTRWAVTLVSVRTAEHAARLQERASRLVAVDHPHLARVGPVLVLPDGRVAVLHEALAGTDLATVDRCRQDWEPGEVVTVVVPLASALAALHEAGLAHGDVAPANVLLVGDGRAVLVDVVNGADPLERGTPGFAAPERARGASAAGDVHALGRVGLALLGEAGAEQAPAGLVAALRTAVDPDPAARPDARELAARVYRACAALPVRPVDPAVLARLTLAGLAVEERDTTERTPRPARGRHRRTRPVRRVVGLSAVTAVLVLGGLGATGVLGPLAGLGLPDRLTQRPLASGPPEPAVVAGSGTSPVSAAVRLTHRRALALQTGQTAVLANLTLPHSPAAAADAALLRSGAPGDGSGELTMVVRSAARHRPTEPGTTDRCAEVLLTAELSGADPSAKGRAAVPVTLRLCPTPAGWRVAEVAQPLSGRPGPAAGGP